MSRFVLFPHMSLRAKLVLSYFLVTLGAILVLAFAVALAVKSYYDNEELQGLHKTISKNAQQFEAYYHFLHWDILTRLNVISDETVIVAIIDTNGNVRLCSPPDENCNDATIKGSMAQALQGQENYGRLQVTVGNTTFSSFYYSIPLYDGDQLIGAMFLTTPTVYPNDFVAQVDHAILIAGIIVASIVVLCSFVLARRFTKPIELITSAAEQMKQGKYTQRVEAPKSQDELGQLAQAFNEMADTIESDVNELHRQEQARRELLANIAHDLATPLTAIQGFSEALADDVISDTNARQETAQRIAREVQRLRRLVADMQNMTSLESGHARLDLAPLDLHSLVDETLTVITPECDQAGLSVHNEITSDAPLVFADSDRITQVLLNLLDNARRHTPDGGSITIGAKPVEHTLLIWVSDTGTGIDTADLPHIFERFYRADRSRTGATGGSGLGLSIVKAIIVAHGGNIWAESAPDRGTRISFTLPLAT